MQTYILIDNQRGELSDESLVLEEGMKIQVEEDGKRKPHIVESIVTVLRKWGTTYDPPFREVRLSHG